MYIKRQDLYGQMISQDQFDKHFTENGTPIRRGLLLSEHAVEVVYFEDTLEALYELTGADTIDMITRKVNSRVYVFVVDDCGRLKENPIVQAVSMDGKEELVGNVLITGEGDEDGNITDLKLADIAGIAGKVEHVFMEGSAEFVLFYDQF